jgi:large subunit ribosomal protein L23
MNASGILLRPVITEKTTDMQERGRYTFEVAPGSTKLDIKQAVQTVFSVDVVKVNTMNIRGKRKRFGPRLVARRSRKKAIVTLAAGQSITIFEGV